jgi:hypothetical protein
MYSYEARLRAVKLYLTLGKGTDKLTSQYRPLPPHNGRKESFDAGDRSAVW